MIEIGIYSDLKILRETSVGLFLGDGEEDVLLPNKYVPSEFSIGDVLRVFVYRDFEERKVAVTIRPKINLHEFAFLKVTAVNEIGAFLDWGMEKELLVPFREQRLKMSPGRWYVVYLDKDAQTDRLFASNRLDNYLDNKTLTVNQGDEVDLLVYHQSDLGYNVIVNNRHNGLIFNNEIFKELNIGLSTKGYVKKIREDNKLDISLQAIGFENYNDKNSGHILKVLKEKGGVLTLNDKSSPEEIYRLLSMSKKAFKKSIGTLYKQGKVVIDEKEVRLNSETPGMTN